MEPEIRNVRLAAAGLRRIEWAEQQMPVLREVRTRFEQEKPFDGVRIAACLHVTSETAILLKTFQAGGAEVALCASNPLSTQDEVAAALVRDCDIRVHAMRGESTQQYYAGIQAVLADNPTLLVDDGADLISTVTARFPAVTERVIAGLEETTTGVARLRTMHRQGVLKFPVFAVNDAYTKYLFDNRYGAGQSTVDGILRATGVLLAGKTVVVAGFGMCGRGIAARMKGLGAKVIITEVDSIKALEAAMEGYDVRPMIEAAALGDIFITATGNTDVLRREHFMAMRDGAFLANSGHFNVEICIDHLSELASDINRDVHTHADEFVLEDGRSLYLLGEGRVINLAAADGHPACVMDMSFSLHALTAEYAVRNADKLRPRVHPVPKDIDRLVARMKLATMGIRIDELTSRQKDYLASWQEGT